MQNIYCISGLGADYRLFKNLSVPGYTFVPLKWLPIDKADTMSTFAMKMAQQITEANPIILGLSFGGMLATEISKQLPAKKIFLVSSAKTRAELGYRSSILKWISDKDIVPSFFFNKAGKLQLRGLGAHSADEKKFLLQIIRDADPAFVRGAIKLLFGWENDSFPSNIIHLHGTNDKIIYSRKVHPDHWIKGGSHIMIYNRAQEVNKIISDCLQP